MKPSLQIFSSFPGSLWNPDIYEGLLSRWMIRHENPTSRGAVKGGILAGGPQHIPWLSPVHIGDIKVMLYHELAVRPTLLYCWLCGAV